MGRAELLETPKGRLCFPGYLPMNWNGEIQVKLPHLYSVAGEKSKFLLGPQFHTCWGRGREGGGDWTGAMNAHLLQPFSL